MLLYTMWYENRLRGLMKHASIMAMTVVKEERLVLYDGVEMCLETGYRQENQVKGQSYLPPSLLCIVLTRYIFNNRSC
jgi:hypothetical protein